MGTSVLAELSEAMEHLAALDPDRLDDAELHELVVSLGPLSSRLEAAWCGLIHAWDRCQIWADNGSKAPGARLARETGMRQSDAKALVRRGRQLTSMPLTSAAYQGGEITGAHVDLIASCDREWANATFAECEQVLVDNCRTAWFGNAVTATRFWQMFADRDANDAGRDPVKEGRHASISTGWDGEVVLSGVFDPVGGEIVKSELERICEQLRLQDLRDGVDRTTTQRRADALVEMAMRSATAPADGLRPRPLFTVTIGIDHFNWMCHTASGTVVKPDVLIPLLSDADIERIVYDPPNRRVEASHRRSFVGAMRRIIEVRDQQCQHPSGCDEPAVHCDVDHIGPRSRGGITCICNGQLLCKYHNRILKAQQDKQSSRQVTKQQRAGEPLPPSPDQRPRWCATDHDHDGEATPRAPPQAG